MTDIYTTELAYGFTYSNITIYRKLKNDIQYAWSFCADEGYVLYRLNANDFEQDIETQEIIPVRYYYKEASVPFDFSFAHLDWVAIPIDQVDSNYIFA